MDRRLRDHDDFRRLHQRADCPPGREPGLAAFSTSSYSLSEHADPFAQQRHPRHRALAFFFYCWRDGERACFFKKAIHGGTVLVVCNRHTRRAFRRWPNSRLAQSCSAGFIPFDKPEFFIFLRVYRSARSAPARRHRWIDLHHPQDWENQWHGAAPPALAPSAYIGISWMDCGFMCFCCSRCERNFQEAL